MVLNDIGPAIEPRGLARLKTYIGRTPAPDDWDDAARILRRLHGGQFTALDDDDWRAFARMTWRDEEWLARPATTIRLWRGLSTASSSIGRYRPCGDEFAALSAAPVLAIRGENSDLLSAETLARMEREHPRFDQIVIAGEGHAPLLIRNAVLQRISAFIMGSEGQGLPADAIVPREAPGFDLDSPRP